MKATAVRQRAPTGMPTPTPTLVALVGPAGGRIEGEGGMLDDADDEGKLDDELDEAALKEDEVDDVDGRSPVGLDEDEAPDALLSKYPIVVNGDREPCKVKSDVWDPQSHGSQQYKFLSHEMTLTPSRRKRLMRHYCNECPSDKEEVDSLSHDFKHFSDFQVESVQDPMTSLADLPVVMIVVLRHKPFSTQAQPLPQHIETSAKGLQGRSPISSPPDLL